MTRILTEKHFFRENPCHPCSGCDIQGIAGQARNDNEDAACGLRIFNASGKMKQSNCVGCGAVHFQPYLRVAKVIGKFANRLAVHKQMNPVFAFDCPEMVAVLERFSDANRLNPG
jgi:hypothetical protein